MGTGVFKLSVLMTQILNGARFAKNVGKLTIPNRLL